MYLIIRIYLNVDFLIHYHDRQKTFSKRFGHFSIREKEITVREDAPEGLRSFIPVAFYEMNKYPSDLRAIVCRVLRVAPDRNNWSEFPNIDGEVMDLLGSCDWYLVYDIIETIIDKLKQNEKETFSDEINEYFITNGIGWKVIDGQIVTRGDANCL